MKTIPTLLTTTKEEFIEQIEIFQKYYSRIQLDIADGKLVPNLTTQIDEIIELMQDKRIGISDKTTFDFHLMVDDFEVELKKIEKVQSLGVHVNLALVNAGKSPNILKLADEYEFSIGLDIFPSTQIDDLDHQYDLELIPSMQIMTVEPGFQGSPFLPKMLDKIEQLRLQDYIGEIMIDGGVNKQTIPEISSKKHTPDFICIGSYLTKAGNMLEKRVEGLKKLE